MKTIPKLGAIGASVALAAATLFAGNAGAEDIEINAPLITPPSGLTIHAPDLGDVELPATDGSGFVGNFDDETGELTGEVTIADGSFGTSVDAPGLGAVDAEVHYAFESGGPIVDGMIDDDGNVSFTDTQTLRLTGLSAVGGFIGETLPESCAFENVELNYEGEYDEDTNTIEVAASFWIPPLESGACGTLDLTDFIGIELDISDTVMGALGYETEATSVLSFERAVVEIPEPIEPEEEKPGDEKPAPTPAAPAAPAKPIAGKPSYTG